MPVLSCAAAVMYPSRCFCLGDTWSPFVSFLIPPSSSYITGASMPRAPSKGYSPSILTLYSAFWVAVSAVLKITESSYSPCGASTAISAVFPFSSVTGEANLNSSPFSSLPAAAAGRHTAAQHNAKNIAAARLIFFIVSSLPR